MTNEETREFVRRSVSLGVTCVSAVPVFVGTGLLVYAHVTSWLIWAVLTFLLAAMTWLWTMTWFLAARNVRDDEDFPPDSKRGEER
jgi:hypothetical protein